MSLDDWKACVLEGADRAGGGLRDQVAEIFDSPYAAGAIGQNMSQLDIAHQIGALKPPEMGLIVSEEEAKGPDEPKIKKMTLTWAPFHSKDFLDPEKRRAVILQVCSLKYADLAEDYCVKSFESREESIRAHLKDNEALYTAMGEEMVKNREPLKLLSRISQIKYSDVMNGIYQIGNSVHLFQGDVLLNAPLSDSKGIPMGRSLTISTGGESGVYFAPYLSAISSLGGSDRERLMALFQGSQVLNPYFFVFGGHSSKAWNAYWSQKLGIDLSHLK